MNDEKKSGFTIRITRLKCLRCGHKWYPRSTQSPKVCPSCGSYSWNTLKESKEIKRAL